jgi:hypothetical protein
MPALETRSEGLWVAAQAAKGTAATAASAKQGRKVGGGASPGRDDGSENWSDGSRFGSSTDFVNTISGDGNPVLQGTADIIGLLSWIMCGQETVTGAQDPIQHVITPASSGFWSTFWKKVGASVGPLRQQFIDCRLSSIRIEGSTANKVVKITPTFTSLLPGVVYTTDPVGVPSTDVPFLYTDGAARFNIDGQIYRAHSSFAIVISDAAAAWYGDTPFAQDVTFGVATVTLEAITILLDAQGLQRYNTQIYGVPAPVAGTQPLTSIPSPGSYTADLQKGSTFTLATTGVPTGGSSTWTLDGTIVTIPYNATAAQVQALLEAHPKVGVGFVTVTGTALPTGPLKVEFLQYDPTVETVASTGLTGGTTPTFGRTDLGIRRQCKLEVPGVKWSPDLSVEGNPDGGPAELALAGEARTITGQPIVRVTTRGPDAAYTGS